MAPGAQQKDLLPTPKHTHTKNLSNGCLTLMLLFHQYSAASDVGASVVFLVCVCIKWSAK